MSTLPLKESFKLEFYKGNDILEHWDRASPSIQKALTRSDRTLMDIFYGLLRAEMQLWLWDNTALVTELQVDKSGKKRCVLVALGGDSMSEWLQCLPLVESWAKDEGCKEVHIYGRIGWAKLTGYDVHWTKLAKEL